MAFSQLKPNVTTYLIEQCWNQAGTALRTSRLTSLAPLSDPNCPKYGTKGVTKWTKLAKKSLLATQIVPEGLFLVGRGGTRVKLNRGIQPNHVGPFFQVKVLK